MPWADEAEQELSRLGLLDQGCLRLPARTSPNLRLKFDVTRQAISPSLCASVRSVPWADEAEQQLSRLALSGCELSADVRILGAGLPEVPGTDPLRYM